MAEERLKLAVFIDFDNIQIGVKDTLAREFDVSIVLEALKERGEVVTKVAYGDWPRAGEQSRQMTQHAVQMVQRNVTPRGDKNGADINLALDALEMAFTHDHINAFAIVGGDSDFIALVEKLKQYDKRVFVVGGRSFTSNILQRNCHEFIAYENLLKDGAPSEASRPVRSTRGRGRMRAETRPLIDALPNIQRALKILAEREVAPQIGLLKSTLLQLDPTFTERDYAVGSFLEFMQKMEQAQLVRLRRTERAYLVELAEGEDAKEVQSAEASGGSEPAGEAAPTVAPPTSSSGEQVMEVLRQALGAAYEKAPNRPLYLRQVRQALRSVTKSFDERRYGPRGTLDLLHQAQREGMVRLQRDRKGILRILPVTSAPTAPPTVIEPVAEPAATISAVDAAAPAPAAGVEASFDSQEAARPEAVSQDVLPLVVEEAFSIQAPPERERPKPRATRVLGKRSPRRTSIRRKPKEPTHE